MRAGTLMLAAVALIAASLVPLCTSLCCPPAPLEASMHASMPCCAGETSMARPDANRVQHSTAAAARVDVAQPATVVVASVRPETAPLFRREATRTLARHEPSPPLFLLNAQFLI